MVLLLDVVRHRLSYPLILTIRSCATRSHPGVLFTEPVIIPVCNSNETSATKDAKCASYDADTRRVTRRPAFRVERMVNGLFLTRISLTIFVDHRVDCMKEICVCYPIFCSASTDRLCYSTSVVSVLSAVVSMNRVLLFSDLESWHSFDEADSKVQQISINARLPRLMDLLD